MALEGIRDLEEGVGEGSREVDKVEIQILGLGWGLGSSPEVEMVIGRGIRYEV